MLPGSTSPVYILTLVGPTSPVCKHMLVGPTSPVLPNCYIKCKIGWKKSEYLEILIHKSGRRGIVTL